MGASTSDIVPRMEDVLTRLIARLATMESKGREVDESLQDFAEADDSLVESMEALAKTGAEAERTLFVEYRILREEWDSGRALIAEADRERMNALGERVRTLSFSIHDLYNHIADRVSNLASRDRDESAKIHRAADALRRYRPDGGEDNRGFNIRA